MNDSNKRPKVKVPITAFEIILEAAGFILIVILMVKTITSYSTLPDRIPTHFNAAGRIDGWGGKGMLWFIPAIAGVMYIPMTLLGRFPRIFNYAVPITSENAAKQYRLARQMITALKLEITALLFYIQWMTIKSANAKEFGTGLGIAFLPITLVAIFGTIIFYIVKSIKNR
ncbi:MAG: DUF1648 domain-containing protein [Bacillota bacterium]|nr:DUF1648 domain-containing protein [Bacillota bacterium]